MLNLFNLKLNNKDKTSLNKDLTKVSQIRHFPPATKEWNTNMYSFNKNTLSLIPSTNKLAMAIIKNYFNMYNKNLERKIRRKIIRIKLRRLSTHKIFISKGEFKHTNNTVIINIYVYNRQQYNYNYMMRKLYKGFKKRKSLLYIKLFKRVIKKHFFFFIKNYNKVIVNSLMLKNVNNLMLKNIKKLINKKVRKQIRYIQYKKLLVFNNLKFKYAYLNRLINLLKKIYNKNVELNIINLKYFYLNSDIFTEYVKNKITKNRKNLYRIMKSSVRKVKIVDKYWMRNRINIPKSNRLILHKYTKTFSINNYLFNNTKSMDYINNLLYKLYGNNIIKETIIDSIENKTITGVRLEAAGRLSKRHTASRSVSKLRYKGSLKNKNSTYDKLSSNVLRGNFKSNIQQTRLNSIARIGSFGIKGWISNN